MKICIFTGIFPPDIGGPAGYVKRIAEEFSRKGIEVFVLTYSSIQKPGEGLDFQVEGVSRKYPKVIRHLLYLMRGFRLAKGADVIYAQNLFSVGIPALIVSVFRKKRLVVKVVGDYAWEQAINKFSVRDNIDVFQGGSYSFFVNVIKNVQSCLAKNADKIIVPSRYLQKIVKGWGVAEEKVSVVYNVPELIAVSNLSKENAKEKIGIFGDIILSVGRLTPWKGFATIIRMMPELLQINPEFKLVIVGDGEQRQVLESLRGELGLQGKVFLTGKVLHEEVPLYFRAADVFILNSRHEGLSHVILEAMQAGVPVVVSNKGGNPELIQGGFNGFLVEYNNKEEIKTAILRLLQDRELARRFVENSKKKLALFSWDKLIEATLNILKEENKL